MRPFLRLLEICALILFLTAAIGAAQDFPLARGDPAIRDAVGYLLSCQNDDGGFNNEPDAETSSTIPTANAAMALALTGDLNRAKEGGNTPLDYLVANPPGDDVTGGSLGRYVMGIVAAGGDPRDVSGVDYVERLKDFAKPPYGEETLFSESYIPLGLAAAGESDSAVAQAFVSYVKDKQHSSGGWGWGGGAPDLDTTGIAVCAVLAAGEDPESQMIKDAVAYIRTQQSDDGGFASSGMSADSNAISDYWAVMALNAAGVDSSEWRKGSETPVSHLLSCQQESGVFWWKPDTQGGAGFLVEATAYGIIALMGERLPITAAVAPPEEGEGATVTVTVLGDGNPLFSRDLTIGTEGFTKDGFEVSNPTVLGALAATGLTYTLADPEGKGSPAVTELEGYGAAIYFVDGARQEDPIGEYELTGGECIVISAPATVLPLRMTAPGEVMEAVPFTIEVSSEDLDEDGNVVSEPVEGATVTVISDTSSTDYTTDDEGKTEIILNEPGEYRAEAKKDGYISTIYLNCKYQIINCLSGETVETTIHVLRYGIPAFSGEVEVPASRFQKDGVWIDNPTALGALQVTGVDYHIETKWGGIVVTDLAGITHSWPSFYAQGSMSSVGFASYGLTGGEWLAVTVPGIEEVPVLFISAPSYVEVGTPFNITVEEEYYEADWSVHRRASSGAKVIIEGVATYPTDANGIASVTLNSAGEYKAKAEKSGCVGTYYIVPGGYHTITATGKVGELTVTKRALSGSPKPGEKLSYQIKICNGGDETLTNVNVTDILQGGSTLSLVNTWMGYVPETNPAPDDIIGNELKWNFDVIEPGDCKEITLVVNVSKDRPSGYVLENCVSVEALNESRARITATGCDEVRIGEGSDLVVTKTADKESVERGKKVKYTIEVCNNYNAIMHDVKVKDAFNRDVEFVSADPAPIQEYGKGDRFSEIIWTFGSIEPDECEVITLEVIVPEMQDFEFGMEHSVSGEGFVNVANDYTTAPPEYGLINVVNVSASINDELFEASDSAIVGVTDPGTELSTREHGSGGYESEELVEVKTEDKSIEMSKDVSATYAATTLGLYNDRSVVYSSRWTETAAGKNSITGTTMSEAYRYATSIDRDSHFKLDETSTSMAFESEFDGMGSFRIFQKPTTEGDPADFESEETYSGSFKVYQVANGSSIKYEKAASGTGSVAADKRIGDEQRSYEFGSGAYESDEIIEAATNYIAKDISLVYQPTSLDLGDLSASSSEMWKEGIWSKNVSENSTTFIGEEFSSLDRLDKETFVRGLGDVATEADFSGMGRFRAISVDTYVNESDNESVKGSMKRLREAEIEIDDQHFGDYSIQRRVIFAGDFDYNEPHLSAEKSGEIFYQDDATLARYNITLKNDGNRALGPLVIKDLFPPGAEFVNASERDSRLTSESAEWTFLNLGLGGSLSFTLWLDVTDCRGDEIVNRIEASAGYNGNVTTAAAFSAIETDWLSWTEDASVTATKTGEVDENDPRIVTYTLTVQNLDESTKVATVADVLPEGMSFLDSSLEPSSVEGNTVTWTLIDIGPHEAEKIVYGAEALRGGRFLNRAVVNAWSVDGSSTPPVYANSIVEIGDFEEEVEPSLPIWHPPDWDFEYMNYGNNLTCEEIVNLKALEVASK